MDAGRRETLRRSLVDLGFDEVRFARLAPGIREDGLRAWLAAGYHGEMAWMERTADKRLDPGLVQPGAASAILLGVNYLQGEDPAAPPGKKPDAAWARYARYRDYHDTLKPALERAGRLLEQIYGAGSDDYRYYVDTGPVLERAWAARAGVGFIGKNAMLISRTHGNWLFLSALLTRVAIEPDAPLRTGGEERGERIGALCGKCTRCLDACPTEAFTGPGVIDSRRCISYLTIENKGPIPREFRAPIGTRIYGCDTCLEVCPWNRFARAGRRALLEAWASGEGVPNLHRILGLDAAGFAALFKGTAVKRIKLGGLLRNACVAAGNSGDRSLLEPLLALAAGGPPLVRMHAVWAVRRLGGDARLDPLRAAEQAPEVLAEYQAPVDPVDRLDSPAPPQPLT